MPPSPASDEALRVASSFLTHGTTLLVASNILLPATGDA